MLIRIVIAGAVGLLLAWVALVVALLTMRPRGHLVKESLRLLPDLLRLLRRLSADRSLPRSVRLRIGLVLAYLAFPLDVVPDFLPVIGYADDAILVAAVLRGVVRRAGPEALERHWPGGPDGLAAVWRLCRLAPRPPVGERRA